MDVFPVHALTTKARKRGGMRVDDATAERFESSRSDLPQKARKHHEIDAVLLKHRLHSRVEDVATDCLLVQDDVFNS